MSGQRWLFAPVLFTVVLVQAGPPGAQADQPAFLWQEARQFDGRSQHVVLPHDPKWLVAGGTLVLDFTADRLKGAQGLLSKDAKGFGDGGHLVVWLDEGTIVARMQDKKSDYVVQSPAKAVKKGVPTRLALTFGPAGMKLSVDGKVVGSNAFNGGLQGNQEPLVIGARDWMSSPRGADNPDAFFAGTISAVALYDRALDGPAIAALGPAGTVLAQATGPGTQPPATPEVAVAPPPASQAPVELKLPPASVSTGVQQSVPVVITEGTIITIPQEEIEKNVPLLRPDQILEQGLQSQQRFEIRSGVSLALQPWRDEAPAVAMFWQRAKQAAGSSDMDEQRAALFVELVKAAFKPQKSDQELRGLEWWARVMKLKRIQAAEGAQQAYADWQSGKNAPRTSPIGQLFGDDKVNTPSYEALLASGFERVSGPGIVAANASWQKVLQRLEAAKVELRQEAASGTDVQAILDGFATTASILASMFPKGVPMGLDPITAVGIGYSLASTRWTQVQEAEDLPGKLAGFLSFAKATTPSLTESLYTQGAVQQAYVALIETTL